MRNLLLAVDAAINLLLGVALLLLPLGLADLLGAPDPGSGFYSGILGAVLFGIGVALLLERTDSSRAMCGLALPGAIAINLCGGLALLAWLLFGRLEMVLRGRITLWIIAAAVVGIALIEVVALSRPRRS